MTQAIARFTVDAFGRFGPGQVCVRWEANPRPTTEELEAAIASAWESAAADCAARGAMLYNGPLVRWRGHSIRNGMLHIDAGPTNFREFVGTNLYSRARIDEIGRERFANPIGTTGTVITADGWLVYGRRSHRVAWHAGYLHTFGGALEAADLRPDGSVDAFAAVHRELAEELRVEAEEIECTSCVGLIHDHEIWQPELLFEIRLRVDCGALLGRLDVDDPHQEHVSLEPVRDEPDALVPFIRRAAPVAPIGVGAICLYGRHRWGEAWYAHALRQLWPEEGERA